MHTIDNSCPIRQRGSVEFGDVRFGCCHRLLSARSPRRHARSLVLIHGGRVAEDRPGLTDGYQVAELAPEQRHLKIADGKRNPCTVDGDMADSGHRLARS